MSEGVMPGPEERVLGVSCALGVSGVLGVSHVIGRAERSTSSQPPPLTGAQPTVIPEDLYQTVLQDLQARQPAIIQQATLSGDPVMTTNVPLIGTNPGPLPWIHQNRFSQNPRESTGVKT
jgi:hypothetical protein